MRELLRRHGARDSLGYFALRRDKSVLWSDSGKSCIAYRVVSGVMLASGDPLGDPEAWPGAISRFVCEAERHAWTPAVMGCSELGGEVWCRETAYDALELGDEAVVEVARLHPRGPGDAQRPADGQAGRSGPATPTEVRRRAATSPPTSWRAMVRQARRWRGPSTERGFSMALGRLGDPADAGCVLVSATAGRRRCGRSCTSCRGAPDGISLDLMRRDRSADPGLNELLIVAALQARRGLGVRRVSLNFAVFRAALERGERLGAGPVSRAWRGLLLFASRWFQIESLYRFNAKFEPHWEPRFLVYPARATCPGSGWPRWRPRRSSSWPDSCGSARPVPGDARRPAPRGGHGARRARASLAGRCAASGTGLARSVMGVVNVTPDSFSDGGQWLEPDAAIAHGLALHGPGRRPGRRRRRVDPARGRAPVGRGGAAPGAAGRRGARRRGARGRQRRHHARRGGRARRSRPARRMVNDVSGGLADPDVPPWSPQPGCRTS